MKKAILFLFFFVTLVSAAVGQNPNDWFITVWDMSKPTDRTINNPSNTIAFTGGGSNYTLYWEDVTNPSINGTVIVSSSNHAQNPYFLTVPSSTGKYRLKAYKGAGSFWGFGQDVFSHHYNKTDPQRLITVEQWGTTYWGTLSLRGAFVDCVNMDVTATDSPRFTRTYQLSDISEMFSGCRSLVNANGSIRNWNTENVENMDYMFSRATLFNQPLSWNTSNVKSIVGMFQNATSFNQPLNWDT